MLKDSVEAFATSVLSSLKIEKVRAPKIIRDALTQTAVFSEHEINIIDLPIVQRLRRIHQTALAMLTYPCAIHNRFEHSVGVANIVDKFVKSLRSRPEYEKLFDDNKLRELRLAAILHDVGHGPFSHPCEEILLQIPEVKLELDTNPKFSKCQDKPHEMLSYLLICSDAFRDIIEKVSNIYGLNIDISRIGNMIVGDMDDPSREAYLSDLINGSFDADKLDYMPRDAYFSGLKMEVDIDRIAYTSFIDNRDKPYRHCLGIDISGAHNLEQILFNKVLLFSSIYHHHKVRSALCMLKSIFEIIHDQTLQIDNRAFDQAIDFLAIDDYDILSSFAKEPFLKEVIGNIRNRQLLKRALIISRKSVKNPLAYEKLIKLGEDPKMIRTLRGLIVDEMATLGKKCSVYNLWIDLPEPPRLREPSHTLVRLGGTNYVMLDKVFPADWWLNAYGETKWKGHVFCPPEKSIREVACAASRKIFSDFLGIEFDDKSCIPPM
jgi:HD superfamily phosphohydrolase